MIRKLPDIFISRIKAVGKKPLCNMRPDRAPRWLGYSFPLCWRCTSIIFTMVLLGMGAGERLPLPVHWLMISLLLLPVALDGIAQYKFNVESTNFRRVVTGFFAGAGLEMLSRYFN